MPDSIKRPSGHIAEPPFNEVIRLHRTNDMEPGDFQKSLDILVGLVKRHHEVPASGEINSVPLRRALNETDWPGFFGARRQRLSHRLVRIRNAKPALPAAFDEILQYKLAVAQAASLICLDGPMAALQTATSTLSAFGGKRPSQLAATVCRLCYWRLGNLRSFHASITVFPAAGRGRLALLCSIFDMATAAAFELQQLRVSVAHRLALDALQLAKRMPYSGPVATTFPAVLLAQILYEEGRLDEAECVLSAQIANVRSGGVTELAVRAYGTLARISLARRQFDVGISIADEAVMLGERQGRVALAVSGLAIKVDAFVLDGNMPAAERTLEQLQQIIDDYQATASVASHQDRHDGLLRTFTLARVRVMLTRSPDSVHIELLQALRAEDVRRNDLYAGVQAAIRIIEMHVVGGNPTEATALLMETIKLGAVTGLYQSFLDGDKRLMELLPALALEPSFNECLPFIGSLFARWRTQSIGTQQGRHLSNASLTARELLILSFVAQGFSNKQIAGNLGIAPETVKSHLKHLFKKLAVGSRAEAAMRAARLGIV